MQSEGMCSKMFSVTLHKLFKPAGWGDFQLNIRQKTLGKNRNVDLASLRLDLNLILQMIPSIQTAGCVI